MADITTVINSPRFTELGQFELDPASASLMTEEYCRGHVVVPLGKVPTGEEPLLIGAVEPKNLQLVTLLEKHLQRPVRMVQLNAYEVKHAIDVIFTPPSPDQLVLDLNDTIRFNADQQPSQMVADMFADAVRKYATDIHIEVYDGDVDLRFRINGVMKQFSTPISPENVHSVINRIKVMAGLDITEKRRPQDGSIATAFGNSRGRREITFRVSVVPGIWGECVAIRVLDPVHFEMNLEHLGMAPEVLKSYQKLAAFPHGMLLVTGPTGSGKTTTLYCTIREMLKRADIKIMTVEDPVEYRFSKVCQTHATPQMHFAEALRAFLRQNADVLLVGEIRDSETAEVAIRAATTGHLILSTVHTKDAISAIARLRVLGVTDDFLSSSIIGIAAQRLVRKICPHCKTAHTPPKALIDSFYKKAPSTFFIGKGCDECGGTGYLGETGVFELLVVNDELASLIARGTSVDEIHRVATTRGYRTLIDDALAKVEQGVTSLEEIARKLPPTYF